MFSLLFVANISSYIPGFLRIKNFSIAEGVLREIPDLKAYEPFPTIYLGRANQNFKA